MPSSTDPSDRPQPLSAEAWDDKLLQSPHTVSDKRARVQKMFAAIAPSYDLNNRLHSLWMDQAWRRKAVKLSDLKATDVVVDVACGTGDLTIQFAKRIFYSNPNRPVSIYIRDVEASVRSKEALPRPKRVIGIDFTYEMLPIARQKMLRDHLLIKCQRAATRIDLHVPMAFVQGDAMSLPLPDASADLVSIAFGIRNVQDPAAAIREFHRVLRPGGRLIVLEFSLPTDPILRGLYNFYFRHILPRTATLISGDKTGAYKYLPESVNTFISRESMMTMMRDAGFSQVEQFPMTFGVCICYRGVNGMSRR